MIRHAVQIHVYITHTDRRWDEEQRAWTSWRKTEVSSPEQRLSVRESEKERGHRRSQAAGRRTEDQTGRIQTSFLPLSFPS